MYAAHFNLREPPFSIAPDPAFLYMSARHQEALGHLLYGAGQYGGFVQLTGEVGTGKTTIVRTLLAQKLGDVDVAMIHNPRQNELEFVQSICDELGVPYPAPVTSIKTLVDALNAHLLERHAAGRRTVLIIDEAQNLPVAVLEQVRLLTNLETDKDKLLRIMLIGQPELVELLARPDLRQLASRITARYHLVPLTLAETTQYIIHRLQVAGGAADLFTEAAMKRVHHYSKGVPRQINILCDRALLGAYSRGYRTVTPAIIDLAAAEALGTQPIPRSRGFTWRGALAKLKPSRRALPWVEGALAIAALIIAGALLSEMFAMRHAAGPAAAASPPAVAAQEKPAVASMEVDPMAALLKDAQPLTTVMSRLVALWRPQLKVVSGENVCRQLARQRLECFRSAGGLADLRQMNRPAVLSLKLPDGGTRYVLLRGLDGDTAVLDTGAATPPSLLPVAQLAKSWHGEYLLLWLRETDEVAIGPETRGDPIVWLRRRLAAGGDHRLDGSVGNRWDPALRDAVRRFQTMHGIDADGVAGVRTLIALEDVAQDSGTPVLSTTAGRTP